MSQTLKGERGSDPKTFKAAFEITVDPKGPPSGPTFSRQKNVFFSKKHQNHDFSTQID